MRNFTGGFDPSQFEEGRPGLFHGFPEQFGAFGFTFSLDDHGALFFAGAIDDEDGTLSLLLGDLFGFDGVGEFIGELDGGEGDVVEDDVEGLGSLEETLTDESADFFALSDQLRRVELSDDTFEDFVDD